jgi:outer membrane protein TolC
MAQHNYLVIAAEKSLTAAHHNVDVVSGQLLPSLSIDGEVVNQQYPNPILNTDNHRAVMLDFSMPLYSGGVIRSQISEAKHRVDQNQAQLLNAHRGARQSATQAWESYQTAKTQLRAIHAQIKAARSAYNSILSEYRVGERTTLNVLDAEQQYLSARVNLVRAQRTQIVAAFALKAAVGHLTARDLDLQVSKVGAP